nr:MAG TPA: hypothetical protein [Caudoviricetes sp.]
MGITIVFRRESIIPENTSSDYRKVLSLHSDPLSAIFIFLSYFEDKESTFL